MAPPYRRGSSEALVKGLVDLRLVQSCDESLTLGPRAYVQLQGGGVDRGAQHGERGAEARKQDTAAAASEAVVWRGEARTSLNLQLLPNLEGTAGCAPVGKVPCTALDVAYIGLPFVLPLFL